MRDLPTDAGAALVSRGALARVSMEVSVGLRFLIQALIAFAQSTIKNPASIAKERKYLVRARDVIDQLIEAIDDAAVAAPRGPASDARRKKSR